MLSQTFPGISFPVGIKLVSVVIWTTTPWTLPANEAVCLHGDIDYAFVQVGDEVLIVAEKLLESVMKACSSKGRRYWAVKKGREGFEGIETQRPLTTGPVTDSPWRLRDPRPLGIEPPIYRRRVDFFTKSRAFDISRARAEIGYAPQVGLRDGIRRTLAWYKERGWL